MSEEIETINAPEYDALVAEIETAKQRVRDAARAAAGALFKAFFAAHPTITAVRWTQYTPYFNDGEPCEFSVHNPYACTKTGVAWPQSNEDDEPEDEDDELFQDEYGLDDGPTKAALVRLGCSFNDEIFLAAFGDHAQVIATPSGFHVTQYDHD